MWVTICLANKTSLLTMQIALIAGWFNRCIYILLLIILFWIFKSEPSKRKIKQETNDHYNSIYQRLLNISSIVVIIFCIIAAFLSLLTCIPYICVYTNGVSGFTWSLIKITLTLYQIARLNYCFSSQQVHSSKYGYSKYTFGVLYIGAIVNIVSTFYVSFFIVHIVTEQIDMYGCIAKIPCKQDFKLILMSIIIYFVWDLTVLFLYIYKVIQIYFKTNFQNECIYNRIYGILRKIIFLTILYEITTVVPMSNFLFVKSRKIQLFTDAIVWCIDILASGVTIYLMMEHNNECYLKFVRCLLCKSDDGIKNDIVSDDNMDVEVNIHDTIHETQCMSSEIQHIVDINESELTVTK
eukprot:121822_1